MTEREKIAGRIRALRAKTVENGCTEAEALAAASLLADLLAKYNMTLDEAELRESPFARHTERHDDWVGDRLWKIAAAVADLTGARYWAQSPGMPVSIDFFGFEHEVEVARYMLEICAGAMRREHQRIRADAQHRRRRQFPSCHEAPRHPAVPRRDGSSSRGPHPRNDSPTPAGKGLVVLRNALIDAAMPVRTTERDARGSRSLDDTYGNGWKAGDRVSLNRGLAYAMAKSAGLLR